MPARRGPAGDERHQGLFTKGGTMTGVKVVEDIAFGAHWPCQSIGQGLCAKVQTGGSPRASREPLVASADKPSAWTVPKKIVISRKV